LLRVPEKRFDLEKKLGIDTVHNEQTSQYMTRQALKRSGVAIHPRLLDRHDLKYWIGATEFNTHYYITYDTDSFNRKEQNPFAFPFLIGKLFFADDTLLVTDKVYDFQASEVLWGLPNGLMASAIFNGKNVRQNEVPVNVAADRRNTGANHLGEFPFSVVPGVSCLGCHSGGMNFYSGTLSEHAAQTTGFSFAEVKKLRELVQEDVVHTTSLTGFNAHFKTAMEKLNMPNSAFDPSEEPVYHTARDFRAYVTVDRAAAELGIDAEELKLCLSHSPDLQRRLALPDPETGYVARNVWEAHLNLVLKDCAIGEQLKFVAVHKPVVADKCKVTINNYTRQAVRFTVNYAGQEKVTLAANASKSWDVGKDVAATMKDVWYQNGNWYSYHDTWTLEPCVNHKFLNKSGRTKLYVDQVSR